jgi:hypothetical protein
MPFPKLLFFELDVKINKLLAEKKAASVKNTNSTILHTEFNTYRQVVLNTREEFTGS